MVRHSWNSNSLKISKIHILVYKFGMVIRPILPLFTVILPNNSLKSLYQTPKLFCFVKYFL